MELRIDKSELVNLTATAGAAVAAKSYIPILGGIKITADISGTITAEGSDANMNIKVSGTADVSEGGVAVIDASMLGGIAKRLDNGTITIETDNTKTILKSGKSKFEIQCLNAADYPSFDTVEDKYKITLPTSKFKEIIGKTTPFAAATEGKKPVLQGVCFDVRGGELYAIASDGLRLAYVPTGIKQNCPDMQFAVPANMLHKLAKIISDDDDNICAVSDGRNLIFRWKTYKVLLRLLDGTYLSYTSLFNTTATTTVTMNKKELTDAVNRMTLMASAEMSIGGKAATIFNISGGNLEISCKTSKGFVKDTVSAEVDGADLRIGFNADYIQAAVKAYENDKITLELSNPTAAGIMRDADGSRYLVLPIRLR